MKRILGKISKEVVNQWDLHKYENKKIVIYPDRKEHCEKHIKDYKCEQDFYYVMNSLEEIIKCPDYVFYDNNKLGLEYYKKLNSNILVAVRLTEGHELKVRSVYPVSEAKIKNRKVKEQEIKNII